MALIVLTWCKQPLPEIEEPALGDWPQKIHTSCEVITADFLLRQEWIKDDSLLTIANPPSQATTTCIYEWEQQWLEYNRWNITVVYSPFNKDVQTTYDNAFHNQQLWLKGQSNFDYEAIAMWFAQEAVWFPTKSLLLVRSDNNVFYITVQWPDNEIKKLAAAQAIANNIILKIN